MHVLINPINGMVVISTTTCITIDTEQDAYVVHGHMIYDPRPSSGVEPVEMDFPEESYCEYQIQDGVPVRIVPKPPAPVPESVSPRQIRQAMTQAGLRAQVEQAVSTGDQDLQDWWEFATEFRRDHQMVAEVAATLGQSDDQIDDIWRLAGSL